MVNLVVDRVEQEMIDLARILTERGRLLVESFVANLRPEALDRGRALVPQPQDVTLQGVGRMLRRVQSGQRFPEPSARRC